MQMQTLSGFFRAAFSSVSKRPRGTKLVLDRAEKPVIEALEARQLLSFGSAIGNTSAYEEVSSAGVVQGTINYATKGQQTLGEFTGTGITPTLVSSTVPTAVIAGAKLHAALKLELTDSLPTTETGYTVRVYASTSNTLDTTTDPLVTTVIKASSIKSARTVPLTIPITTLPSTLANGSYYLIAQTTDSAGNTASVATGTTVSVAAPFISLSEAVTPPFTSALVGGAAAKGSVKVKITNNGNEISTGTTAIDLSFSATPGLPGTSFATLNKRLSIPVGKSVTVAIPVKTIPVVPDGSYYVIASVSNPDGGVTVGTSPSTTLIATPFITLGATVSNITNVKAGVTVVVTNSGNSVDSTRLTGTFGLASDSQGLDAVGGTATITSAKVNIQPGKSIKVHIKPSKAFLSTLVPGTEYYLTLAYSDDTGHTGFTVSTLPFTV